MLYPKDLEIQKTGKYKVLKLASLVTIRPIDNDGSTMSTETMSKIAPYGSWQSPINAQMLVAQNVRLSEPKLSEKNNYWIEGRPQEQGRCVIVGAGADGKAKDLLPSPFNARSSCHEYGGASYCLDGDDIYFINAADQGIYLITQGSPEPKPVAICPEGHWRYTDMIIDSARQRIICVAENHQEKDLQQQKEEQNFIVTIDLSNLQPQSQTLHSAINGPVENPEILIGGADFYSNPSISPDGNTISWLCWNHPNMPWDVTECWTATLSPDGKTLSETRKIAGGISDTGKQESVFQPQFGPDGYLYFVSDRNNWWNIYRSDLVGIQPTVETITDLDAEFATPQWVFGMSCYDFLDNNTILCCYTQNGRWGLASIDLCPTASNSSTATPNKQESEDTSLNSKSFTLNKIETLDDNISMICAGHGRGLYFGASNIESSCLRQYEPNKAIKTICQSSSLKLPTECLSAPQAITFASGAEEAHGFYYAPQNTNFHASADELPPLIVLCHGGPTGATDTALNLKIQFWCSRGFAVFDINYRGSTGYGRHYRDSLKKQWGVKDVEDVCAGARHLVRLGLADPNRLAIKGGSAGGYTVLAALTFTNTFSAGASHYGIGDLETLARDTHKFESRYLDSMVGPYPQDIDLYKTRSPINHVEQLNCPVIFFQGLEDRVVPPNQAEEMVTAIANKGLPVAYIPFAGEGHGFRGAHAIVNSLENELYFYSQVFAFTAGSDIKAIPITNMSAPN